jgi:hypothetical protein
MDRTEVLLIGGRAGVGKSTVGWEVSARLRAAAVSHAIIEGDFMGQVHPAPEGDPHRSEITERNLTAVWGNYAELGYRRLVCTNTLSVLPEATGMFERAMGADVRIVRVLLAASDVTAGKRLAGRELGSELEEGLKASAYEARLLDQQVSADTVRVVTDGRAVVDIAREVVAGTESSGCGHGCPVSPMTRSGWVAAGHPVLRLTEIVQQSLGGAGVHADDDAGLAGRVDVRGDPEGRGDDPAPREPLADLVAETGGEVDGLAVPDAEAVGGGRHDGLLGGDVLIHLVGSGGSSRARYGSGVPLRA